jgi:hypothetical protein
MFGFQNGDAELWHPVSRSSAHKTAIMRGSFLDSEQRLYWAAQSWTREKEGTPCRTYVDLGGTSKALF